MDITSLRLADTVCKIRRRRQRFHPHRRARRRHRTGQQFDCQIVRPSFRHRRRRSDDPRTERRCGLLDALLQCRRLRRRNVRQRRPLLRALRPSCRHRRRYPAFRLARRPSYRAHLLGRPFSRDRGTRHDRREAHRGRRRLVVPQHGRPALCGTHGRHRTHRCRGPRTCDPPRYGPLPRGHERRFRADRGRRPAPRTHLRTGRGGRDAGLRYGCYGRRAGRPSRIPARRAAFRRRDAGRTALGRFRPWGRKTRRPPQTSLGGGPPRWASIPHSSPAGGVAPSRARGDGSRSLSTVRPKNPSSATYVSRERRAASSAVRSTPTISNQPTSYIHFPLFT